MWGNVPRVFCISGTIDATVWKVFCEVLYQVFYEMRDLEERSRRTKMANLSVVNHWKGYCGKGCLVLDVTS